jgi:hypothetical protein
MDGLHEFLVDLQRQGYAQGNFLGLLNVLIGRRIQTQTGELICDGLTWRVMSERLKKVRWDKEAVRELGLDPKALPPRDRQRYWFAAVSQAGVDTEKAKAAGDRLAKVLQAAGYQVTPGPAK